MNLKLGNLYFDAKGRYGLACALIWNFFPSSRPVAKTSAFAVEQKNYFYLLTLK
jgi:hypothetical protein